MGKLSIHASSDSTTLADAETQAASLLDEVRIRTALMVETQVGEDPFAQIRLLKQLLERLNVEPGTTVLAALSGNAQQNGTPAALPGGTGGNPTDADGRRRVVIDGLRAMVQNGELSDGQLKYISAGLAASGSPNSVEVNDDGRPVAQVDAENALRRADALLKAILKTVGDATNTPLPVVVNETASDTVRRVKDALSTSPGGGIDKATVKAALDVIEAGIRGLGVDRVRGEITNRDPLRTAMADARQAVR